jgi:dihydroorotase
LNLILRDIHLFSAADGLDEISDLEIVDGIIQKIGKVKSSRKNTRELPLRKKTCVPGLYDMHVHFRDPGRTHKEDLYTGSEAAMNGGFTGVLCMPNTDPPIDSPLILKNVLDRSKNFLINIDVAACATKNRGGEQLSPILSLFEAGAIAFTDDGSPIANPELLRRVLEYTSQTGSVVIQHCEDMRLSNGGVINEGLISTLMGVRGIPDISESSIVARDILITEFVKNSRYHIQHISCAKSVSLLRSAKERNINVTGEVCPHHFILSEKECLGFNANAKMNPPLRTESDIEEILKGLRDNTIEVICTDHAPHTEYEKNQDFYEAPFGIVGLETAVGLVYTYLVKSGVISFEQMIEKMSVNPRRILALDEVRIREGEKANLTILDTKAKWRINKGRFKSRSRNTPFENYEVQCRPYCVINNDQIFYTRL